MPTSNKKLFAKNIYCYLGELLVVKKCFVNTGPDESAIWTNCLNEELSDSLIKRSLLAPTCVLI